MNKENIKKLKVSVKKVAETQAPTYIDPDNTDLNGNEVYKELQKTEKGYIDNIEKVLKDVRLTKDGHIYKKDKIALGEAGLEVGESYHPEYPNRMWITVEIPTAEDKSMPDNDGSHKITVERDIED